MNSTVSDVLIVYVDQWRWDALGCLGSAAQTPELDKLVANGVLFDHAFVQSPVCMPSRVSMLTGRYPSSLGITQMGVPVPESTETLATILSRRGWRTANLGKLHFLPHANRDHTRPHPHYGFDVLALSDEPGVYEDDYRAWVRSVCPDALSELSSGLPPAAAVWQDTMSITNDIRHMTAGARADYDRTREFDQSPDLTHSAWVGTRTIEHLRSLSDHERSFTIASFFSPHAPYHVPRKFLDLYERDELPLPKLTHAERARQDASGLGDDQLREIRHGYYAAISEVDFHVGRILSTLEELGRTDRTLVLFVSDHGEWLGDHLRLSKGYPADDAVSRVPLIAAFPGGAHGQRESRIVEALDVAPTVLDALGVPVPTDMQGTSLLPALRGNTIQGPEIAVTEHHGWRSVRTPHHRYVISSDGTEQLWDVSQDPSNEAEVAVDRDALLAARRKDLITRMLNAERTLPREWPY
jgi:arylsulfatase A-like enzyme